MTSLLRPLAVWVAAAALSAAVQLVPTDGSPYPPPILTRLTVVYKSAISNQIGTRVFASCLIQYDGANCTITTGKSVSREVQLAFGMTWAAATSQLGIGRSTSITTTVSCQSPGLPAGTTWKARPVGTKYTYKIRRDTIQAGHVIRTATSGRLTAFNPSASHIACGAR
jgi:hypothetical protein